MLFRRFLSGLTAISVSLAIFVVPAYAAGVADSNKSQGLFDLKCAEKTVDYYEVTETKNSDDKNIGLDFYMTSFQERRMDIVDYYNKSGVDAKFAHTRFLVSVQKNDKGDASITDEIRLIYYIGNDPIFRFNFNWDGRVGIFGGESKFTGFSKEHAWQVSSVAKPFYNTMDIIQNCENGAIYLFLNGRLAAYSTAGATDGKFYGYTFSKDEDTWDEGDVLSIKFDSSRIGHTIYKDGSGATVTLEDVLADAGISESAYSPYKDEINKNIKYVQDGEMFVKKQKEPILVTGSGKCIQAEEGSYTANFGLGVDRDAADTKVMKALVNDSASSIATAEFGDIEIEFQVDQNASYTIWLRFFAQDKRSDSVFYSFNGAAYKNQDLDEEKYYWFKAYTGKLEPNKTYKMRIRHREVNACVDCMLVTNIPGHTPSGRYGDMPETTEVKVDPLDPNRYANPPITPPAKTHPRVMFREEDIPRIKANMESPMNSAIMESYREQLGRDLDSNPESYSVTVIERAACYALEYAINGDKEKGVMAKQYILALLKNVSFSGGIESTVRPAGHTMHVAAKIYDWCYDLFTPSEREQLIVGCVGLSSVFEMTWPPVSQGVLTSHGAEAQLLRDYMSLAIAVYDERPDFWDFIGGRYFEKYVPIRQTYNTVLWQGSDYGIYRQIWAMYSYALIKGMGYDWPIDPEKYYDDALWPIYYRRPDGQTIRSGDISLGDKTPMWEYWEIYVHNYIGDAYLSKNPYSKLEYARETDSMDEWTNNKQNYTSLVDVLIMNDADVEPAKTFEDLPYTKYFGTPNGIMVARTGWEDGADSPTVVAEMKVQEYQINGHMHLDAGHFQIYYKGMLASDSGVYQGAVNQTSGDGASAFGSPHFNQYQTKTVAHNCMLVYDPSEANPSSDLRRAINDGGQRAVNNGNELGGGGTVSEDAHVARVTGMEIDPKNPHKPAYSYLKGDLTNAYSEKVTDYKRSFMFLNLDNSEVPAAMIVFDKIDSSNASFKKTWLLHGLEEPEINGNRTIFRRTYASAVKSHAYNGKMTVDTLLPANNTITKVGGETGYYTAGGKNYDAYPFKTQTDEGQTWRIEVSPKAASQGDYFLNVIQVSDNDKENYLGVEMIENNLFYGVKIADRIVAFSKSAKRVGSDFALTVSGNGNFQYTICDIEAGVYTVTVGGKTIVCTVTEEGGVLSFTAPSGNVSVKKTPDATPDKIEIAEKRSTKDPNAVSVRIDNVFVYHSVPAVLRTDTIVIAADQLKKEFKIKTDSTDNTITLMNRDKTVTFTNGSNISSVNGEEKEMSGTATVENGVWMVPVRAAIEALGGSVSWDRWSNTLFVSSPPMDLTLPSGYAIIVKAVNDGGAIDGENTVDKIFDEDASTIWASNGVGRYVTLELEKESTLTGVEIMFNPNQGRDARFAISVSSDGKKYEQIYSGAGDGSVEEGAWERFMFSTAQTGVKYVRYIANGSNISNWNAVKEIRFMTK